MRVGSRIDFPAKGPTTFGSYAAAYFKAEHSLAEEGEHVTGHCEAEACLAQLVNELILYIGPEIDGPFGLALGHERLRQPIGD